VIKSNHLFTLIELLVVIFIIAILTSLLVPSANYVLASSKNTHCINNIKQLGIVILEQAYKTRFPNDILFTGTSSKDLYKQACGWVLPPDPPEEAPEEVEETASQTGQHNYKYVLDTANFGCPLAEKNPLFGVEGEPEYRSYGALKYNLMQTIESAHTWVLTDSIYRYITTKSELATDRHIENKVNLLNIDASVKSTHFSEVTFPQ